MKLKLYIEQHQLTCIKNAFLVPENEFLKVQGIINWGYFILKGWNWEIVLVAKEWRKFY